MKAHRDTPFIVLLVLAGALAAPLGVLASALPLEDAGVFLVIGPDAPDIVARAGGTLVGPERAPLAAFASGGADIVANLEAAGAWWVTDAGRLAALCL